jgi:hypothetical protein
MKKALVLAAALSALATAGFAEQAKPAATLSTQGQETGVGLGLGGLSAGAVAGIVGGALLLGLIVAGGGDDDSGSSTTTTTTTTPSQ